jgi:hypothetical protein
VGKSGQMPIVIGCYYFVFCKSATISFPLCALSYPNKWLRLPHICSYFFLLLAFSRILCFPICRNFIFVCTHRPKCHHTDLLFPRCLSYWSCQKNSYGWPRGQKHILDRLLIFQNDDKGLSGITTM